MTMPKWVVFYKDGSLFSSLDGKPASAPKDYVQVVMQITPEGRDLMDSYDHYAWHNDRWIPHDASGIDQYRNDKSIREKVVLNGYWIADEIFWLIHNAALDHPVWKHLPVRIIRPKEMS